LSITAVIDSKLPRGRDGDELQDYAYNINNPRRRSNSFSHGHSLKDFKTKFETIETDPVFEEEVHGPSEEDLRQAAEDSSGYDLEKESTTSSADHGSVDMDADTAAMDKKI
jgi:hypothetical protein